jgi:hypothetical protein
LRAVLAIHFGSLVGPVPVSIFPPEAFGEDERNKIASKATILLARESTQGRVFPMSFEEIDAIALLALDQMCTSPSYFALLAIFDIRRSMVLLDKFDSLEKLIIEGTRNIKSGSNSEEVVRELYAQIANTATASAPVAAKTSEVTADSRVDETKLKDFLAAVGELNDVLDKSGGGVPEGIRQKVKLLNDQVAKLTEASEI